jgi:ATP-dependent exoDNAse (exonuclease V) beta subunit
VNAALSAATEPPMRLTDQQRAAIEADEPVVKINAVAGSGKTTTLIEYAARRSGQSILYLTYNKSVAEEVRAKVAERRLDHVKVHTIHSLAYRQTNASQYPLESELSEGVCSTATCRPRTAVRRPGCCSAGC